MPFDLVDQALDQALDQKTFELLMRSLMDTLRRAELFLADRRVDRPSPVCNKSLTLSVPLGYSEKSQLMKAQLPPKAPWIWVITPAFNAAATLPRAFRSLQAQTFARWEYIVVDCSADNTRASSERLPTADSCA